MQKIISLVFVFLFVVSAFAANEICVTNVEKKPVTNGGAVYEIATIALNDCIKVKEIQIIKVGGKTTLRYPTYVSANGREYPQFEPLTKQAKDEIEKAVLIGKPSVQVSKSVTFKISKFSRYRKKSALKVFVSLDFNNAIRIECKIMETDGEPWVSWPARKPIEGGQWVKQILIIDKKLQNDIEKALLQKYETIKSESDEE
jgi:DNA-binding cell septation regulator SpoVG